MKTTQIYIILFCFTFFLASPQFLFAQKKKTKQKTGMSQKEKLQISSWFIDGKKESMIGNYNKAITLFDKCLEKNPKHSASFFELGNIYEHLEKYEDAVDFVLQAKKNDPKNYWYSEKLASLYNQTGQYDKASKIYEDLLKTDLNNIDMYFTLAATYMMNEDLEKAIETYDEIEVKTGISEEISIQKQKLYLMSKQPEMAIKEIENLSNNFPAETKYQSMLAKTFMQNEDFDKALNAYNKILKTDPNNLYIHIDLAEYYRITGKPNEAIVELKKAFENPKLEFETKAQVFFAYIDWFSQNKEYEQPVIELSEILANVHPDKALAQNLYAEQLAYQEKFEEAISVYHKSLKIDSSRFSSWQNLLLLETKVDNNKLMRKDSERAMKLFPFQPLPYLFNGISNYILKDYQNASSSLEKGKKLVVDDNNLMEEFYTYLGETYYKQKDYASSDKAFETVLKINPKNSYILNNYAYYLSLRNEKLEDAEKMAKDATYYDPDNVNNMDTYGWVLYKLGKYEEAEKWILKAIDNSKTKSDVVLEHYGDVLFKLGQKNEALNYWQKAKTVGEGSEFLEKKIKEEELIEE